MPFFGVGIKTPFKYCLPDFFHKGGGGMNPSESAENISCKGGKRVPPNSAKKTGIFSPKTLILVLEAGGRGTPHFHDKNLELHPGEVMLEHKR